VTANMGIETSPGNAWAIRDFKIERKYLQALNLQGNSAWELCIDIVKIMYEEGFLIV
jgi:long-subunit fatty acid transport protein